MSFPQRDKPIAKVCLLRPLPAGWTYPNGKEGHRSRCRRRREMGATDFCLRPNKRIFSALTQPAVIGVRQKRVDTTNHAERKIILPAQPRTVRNPEARVSAVNCRIEKLKRLVSKRGYSLALIASEVGVTQVTVNHWWTGYSLTAKQRKYRAAEKVFGCSISRLSVRGT